MEAAISAITGDLISRIISFLVKKYTEKTAIEDKLERLQQLLLRIHAVVEEADGRCITNTRMLLQLKLLVASMYRGYHVLDSFRYRFLMESFFTHDECTTSFSVPPKRSRTIHGIGGRGFSDCSDLQSVLKDLEDALANMTEFVVLLGGCERMCRRPYDTYLYTDNFMFGRHIEKQQIINSLLREPSEGHNAPPMVLPVIGGIRVGKKTLISHVCMNDRIRSYFPSIIFLNGDIIREIEHVYFSKDRTLVVIEFVTDVDDDDWVKFCSVVKRKAPKGSKVVIVSRIQSIARFGTVKPVCLNSLSLEEFRYLFKMLAFGSADEKEYPQFASLANMLATALGGSFITANVVADLLRQNWDLQFWLHVWRRFKTFVDYNISKYGRHPKDMLEEGPIDISKLMPSYPASLRVVSPHVEKDNIGAKCVETQFSLSDIISGHISPPNEEFLLVAWESRVPPYTKHVCAVVCADQMKGSTRKRRSCN